jgi:hypothetical protein
MGPTSENEFLRRVPPGENYFDGSSSQFGGDVKGVGNDGQMLKAAQGARDRRSSGAGVENDNLAFLHHRSRAVRDAEFFPAVEPFLLAERGIFDGAVARGNRAAVSAVDRPVSLQDIEILADRNLGGFEVAGEFGDQNPALTTQQIDYGAA